MLLCLLTIMATFSYQPPRRTIALLHGTAGSENTLRAQLGPLVPKLEAQGWDVTFVEGPRVCAEDNPHVKMMRRFYGANQILREYAEATTDDRGWRSYKGVHEAVEALETAVGRPDCLLGFSQAPTSRRCSSRERNAAARRSAPWCCSAGRGNSRTRSRRR